MAAPVGNSFWELRGTHGRDKLFETPEIMKEVAGEYFIWCNENPLTKKDWVGKDADEIEREFDRPYTMHGLCLYLGVNTAYFRQFKSSLKDKTDAVSKDFSTIIQAIEDMIYQQKFEGAAVGFFNANIIARDLGLRDKTELSTPPEGEGGFNVTLKIE